MSATLAGMKRAGQAIQPSADRSRREEQQVLDRLGFLTIGLFDPADPGAGHESTLRIIELGEQLGFDSAWLRHRHLQYGISSPVAVLAAASQRTSRIELGTAVTPLGWENPLRLAEDWATVDVLSGGRLNPGLSVGPPMRYDEVRGALYPDTGDVEDFTYERVERLLRLVRGESASPFRGRAGSRTSPTASSRTPRASPRGSGTAPRALGSARWAGEHGLNLLTSSVVKAEESEDFEEVQLAQVQAFRAAHPLGDARARLAGTGRDPDRRRLRRPARALHGVRRGPAAADPGAAGPGADDVRPRPRRHLRGARRAAARPRGVPRGERGGVRAAVHLRGGRLRADPHRDGDQAGAGAGLAAPERLGVAVLRCSGVVSPSSQSSKKPDRSSPVWSDHHDVMSS